MNQNKNGRVISLKALIKTVLIGWRKMLITGLILAIVLGGYRLYKRWPSTRNNAEGNAVASSSAAGNGVKESGGKESASAGGSATSGGGLDYSTAEKLIRTSLDQKNTYLANSILAKINPNAEGRAEVNLFISTKELENLDESGDNEDGVITTIQPTDPASAGSGNSNYTSDSMNVISYAENSAQVYADHIMDAYLSYAINSIDFTDLAKKYNTEPMYLKELINIKNIQNDVVSATISVRYIDENGAKEILHTIVDQLKAQKEEIAKTYGSHTVRFENETSATVVDNVMFPWLNSRIQEMNNLMNNQDTFRTAVSSRTSGGSSASTVVSGKSVIKDSVKYAAVGFVGGLLLYLLIGMLLLVLMKRVLSAKELNQQYSLQKLAVLPGKGKENGKQRGGLDRLIASIGDEYKSADTEEECFRIAAANINYLTSENAKIMIAGDLSEGQMKHVLDELKTCSESTEGERKIRFIGNGGRVDDPKSLHLLSEADAVVLVAGCRTSRYASLDEIIRTADTYGKKIVGSIVLWGIINMCRATILWSS